MYPTLGDSIVTPIVDDLVNRMIPKVQDAMTEVAVKKILPPFGLATVLGMTAGAVAAAAIGSWFASRRR